MKDRMKKGDRQHYEAWNEQRRWHRYPPANGVLAHVEGRSYRLLDISAGGVAIYDYGGENVPDETLLSLHSIEGGHFLSALKCRKVSDNRMVSYSPHGPEVINRVGLEILESDPDFEVKLDPFIRR